MKYKRILITFGLIASIYGISHLYFQQKTPAILKLALATIERSGLKVAYATQKSGNYLFRPYVELGDLTLETQTSTLPSLKLRTESPTRFMLNWWQGQSLTITNKGQAHIQITYPHLQCALIPSWLEVTVDTIDIEPSLRNLSSEFVEIQSTTNVGKNTYVLQNLSFEKNKLKKGDFDFFLNLKNFSTPDLQKEQKSLLNNMDVLLNIPESVKNPFQANWLVVLAENKEFITIKKVRLVWNQAAIEAQGTINVDEHQLPHITLQTSMSDFETFVANLNNHPMIHTMMIKSWQALLAVLKATSKSNSITFEYKSNSIYINGIESFKNLNI